MAFPQHLGAAAWVPYRPLVVIAITFSVSFTLGFGVLRGPIEARVNRPTHVVPLVGVPP